MTEKRFSLSKDTEWWFVQDNTIQVNKYGYRDDLTGEDEYRGLHQELTEQETVDLLNELHEENQLLHEINEETINFMYDNFDSNIIFTDRELNDICNEMGWELSEKGIKIKQLEEENEQLKGEVAHYKLILMSLEQEAKRISKIR